MDGFARTQAILADCLMIPTMLITPQSSLSDLGEIDSLTFELIVGELEEALGHAPDPVVLLNAETASDIATMLERG